MKMVKPAGHTKTELQLMAMAINRYGNGQHPAAEEATMNFFTCEYVIGCLEAILSQRVLNDDGYAVARNAMATLRANLLPVITEVYAQRLPDSRWRYTAVDEDGSEEVVRQRATKLYLKAFMYTEPVTSGNKQGLTRYFTFGKEPNRYYRDKLHSTHPVALRCHRCQGEVTTAADGYRGCETCGGEV
jgi:hypothetical protein